MKFYCAHLAAYHRDRLFSTILVSYLQPSMDKTIEHQMLLTRTRCVVCGITFTYGLYMYLFKENYFYLRQRNRSNFGDMRLLISDVISYIFWCIKNVLSCNLWRRRWWWFVDNSEKIHFNVDLVSIVCTQPYSIFMSVCRWMVRREGNSIEEKQ